jgi:hypothetical protein
MATNGTYTRKSLIISGGGGGRTRVLEQGLDRFYKFVRADFVGIKVVAQLTPYP